MDAGIPRQRRDHPRGCGGASLVTVSMTLMRGSSPRVRGSRAVGVVAIGLAGIIPAGAGEPCWC